MHQVPEVRRGDPVRRTRRADQALATMVAEVRAGLARRPLAELPCKYFYDERGSALFERDHAPARVLPDPHRERRSSSAHADAIVEAVAPFELAELGSGAGRKIRFFLDAMRSRGWLESVVLLEINEAYLRESVGRLQADFPEASRARDHRRLRAATSRRWARVAAGCSSSSRARSATCTRTTLPRVLPRGGVGARARRRLPRRGRPRQGRRRASTPPTTTPPGVTARVQPQHPPRPERPPRRRLRPLGLRAPRLLRPRAAVDRDAPARAPRP